MIKPVSKYGKIILEHFRINMKAENPIIYADFPDPDVIRVGDVYYMVTTSMHIMPGCPIMKSRDLVHWEIVNYVFDTLEDHSAHNLEDGRGIYGFGSYAACLRLYKGKYYVCFSCYDLDKLYIFSADDIEKGGWERTVIPGKHVDPSLLFDAGRIYLIYGLGNIYIKELTDDLKEEKKGGRSQLLFSTSNDSLILRCEGCRAYKIDGYYYLLFVEWPKLANWRRRQICYRSKELLGGYERRIILDDDMGYKNSGIAQGAIFDTPQGEWYAMLFQDHGAVGRIPYLLPLSWEDGWPVIGEEGTAPKSFETEFSPVSAQSFITSDEFDSGEDLLKLQWQWNHNPDNALWSLTERPGYLRLKTGRIKKRLLAARNTLTQRTKGPSCAAYVKLDTGGMKCGDYAGITALQNNFAALGVHISPEGEKYVKMCVNDGIGGEKTVEKIKYTQDEIYLRARFYFEDGIDIAKFEYSCGGEAWNEIGGLLKMKFSLAHFTGCRIGLFNYASIESGGCADFDFFRFYEDADMKTF